VGQFPPQQRAHALAVFKIIETETFAPRWAVKAPETMWQIWVFYPIGGAGKLY
jgi:hypothetical protein